MQLSGVHDPRRRSGADGPLSLGAEGRRGPPGTATTICLLDGAIANLDALAEQAGCSPGSVAETIVARAFEQRGELVLHAIHGSWSLLLWDNRRSVGLLATDPLGGRPLHYHRAADGRTVFASEVRDLIAALDHRPDADARALAHWLARRPLPGGATLLEGVRRLPAGHLLRLGAAAEPLRWWTPRYEPPLKVSRDEAASRLRVAMNEAVARALADPEASAVMLSGGFDSASVAALAAAGRAGLPAYSLVFPGQPDVDESERIELARESLGLGGVAIQFDGGSPLAAASEFVAAWGLPPATPNGFVWRPLARRAAADRVATLLDGEGGDELFGCSPPLIADLLRAARPRAAVATARRLPGYPAAQSAPWTRRALRTYGLRDALGPRAHRIALMLRPRTTPTPAWLSAHARRLLDDDDRQYRWKRLDGPRWWAALAASVSERPDALGVADELRRMTSMHGVERAHPWRDLALVEHILRLPPQLAFDPELDRPLAREAMRGKLVEPLRTSTVKPYFNSLLNDRLAGADRKLVERLLVDELPEQLAPFVLGDEVATALADGRVAWGARLWPLISAAVWLSGQPEPA